MKNKDKMTKINKKEIKLIINLETATAEQKEQFFKSLADAYLILYKSVVTRKMRELAI